MRKIFLFLTLGALLSACEDPEPPTGRALFMTNCVACHGDDGKGDGWVAAGLKRKPADLTTIARRNGGEFPLAEVLSTIDGFHRQTFPDSAMPEFGYLFQGPIDQVDVGDGIMTPVPQPLLAVAEYLRSIQE